MRTLQQGGCPDLVSGGVEAAAEVAAGSSATVLAFDNVGPIYLAGAAEVSKDVVALPCRALGSLVCLNTPLHELTKERLHPAP